MTRTAEVRTLTRKNRTGLVLAALLGLTDLTNFLDVPPGDSDLAQAGPPTPVVVGDGVLGLITLVAVVHTWRTAARIGSRVVAATRIVSAVTSLPALFLSGVPDWVVALVAVSVIVSVVVVSLVLSRPEQPPEAAAP
ncbi:hypothetical protein ABZT17_36640 [Streptomyces sp. NPDC005648]|uniref:hypothetical protein n=1 Tax=Streptomyces sp. NPDC005648 TaxID=3157044 RepID=UPI0033A77A2E